jgi:flavin-dependent dehydrogenase
MSHPVRSVIIVGGGTAGWLTAGTLAARVNALSSEKLKVTLVESPDVPTIGVGEGTWPSMRRTLKNMGIRETDFMRECKASFKQGGKFARWHTGAKDDYYYHPLILPQGFHEMNLAPHWLDDERGRTFSAAVCPQDYLCDRGLAPKQITTPEYAAVANYSYHLDAGAFSEFLKKHCVDNLGVRHVLDNVTKVNAAENGDIASVTTVSHGDIAGDLFIDCTGFKSLLLGEHYDVPFVSCKDILFVDTALAVQVPYPAEDAPIASQTIGTAQEAGWIWDIGLPTRRGVGHVYSSDYMSDERAHEVLRDYLRPDVNGVDSLSIRKIPIKPGHRTRFWERNCVAIGLSAGFLEPLEASALLLIEIAGAMIADQFPATRESMDVIAKRYNETFLYRWDRIIDFLKLHYMLSVRTDSKFWIDNRDPDTIPESLKELLVLWRYQCPWHDDFDRAVEVFPAASYQYVLYGMGFKTEPSPLGLSDNSRKMAAKHFESNENMAKQMIATMPKNRELLNKIYEFGLQRV